MKNKKAIMLIVIVLASLCMAMVGCDTQAPTDPTDPTEPASSGTAKPGEHEINWTLQGAVIDLEGNVIEELQLTATGIMYNHWREADELDMKFTFPEDCQLSLFSSDKAKDVAYPYEHINYFVSMSYSYDKQTNEAKTVTFALDIKNEYFILFWNDTYIAASNDPDTDPISVFAHFSEFRNSFCKSK